MFGLIPLGYRLVAYAFIALALIAFGWVKGADHESKKFVEYIGKQATETVRIATARGQVTERVITKYVKVAGKTKLVTETVEKEVIKYAEANPGLCLDAPWRVLHDRAADNAVPGPGRTADAALGAPAAAEALDAVTASYAACHRTADRLDGLQDWIREQRKVK